MNFVRSLWLVIFGFSASILFAQTQPFFSEITEEIGIPNFKASVGQGHGSGITLVDVDQNGLLDIFVLANQLSPNYLMLNNGDSWSTIQFGPSSSRASRSAVWLDYDADGDLDVFISSDCNGDECFDSEAFQLFRNDDLTFENVSEASQIVTGNRLTSPITGNASITARGTCAGDINLDGFVDIISTRRRDGIFIFLNNGDGTFSDGSSMLPLGEQKRFYQPMVFDFSGDGWPDIFLTVDGNTNSFYRNDSSQVFNDIARAIDLNSNANDMGVAIGDYDNDGDYDVYVSNIQRVNSESGNLFFVNEQNDETWHFTNIARSLSINPGGWGWGVTFFDANNDGIQDLAATNGWNSTSGGFNSIDYREDPSKLWIGDNEGQFTDFSTESNFNDTYIGSVLIAGDLERDGDLDLIQGLTKQNENRDIRVLRNELQQNDGTTNFLVVQPRMTGQNKFAIGANVEIFIGDDYQQKPILAGTSIYGQEPPEAFFGMSNSTEIDKVIVTWPGGKQTIVENVSANQLIEVTDENILHNPGYLAGEKVDDTEIIISWGHMSTYENRFELQRSSTQDFSDFISHEISAPTKTFTDSDVETGVEYFYRVRAKSEFEVSAWSPRFIFKNIEPILSPTGLTAELTDSLEVNLTWSDNASNETAYHIRRSTTAFFTTFFSIELAENSTEYKDTNLEPSTEYFYTIYADNDETSSNRSGIVSIVTGSLVPNTPLDAIAENFNIFPNPTSGVIRIELGGASQKNIQARLLDLQGKQVETWNLAVSASGIAQLPLAGVHGMHILEIEVEGVTYTRKVLFE